MLAIRFSVADVLTTRIAFCKTKLRCFEKFVNNASTVSGQKTPAEIHYFHKTLNSLSLIVTVNFYNKGGSMFNFVLGKNVRYKSIRYLITA